MINTALPDVNDNSCYFRLLNKCLEINGFVVSNENNIVVWRHPEFKQSLILGENGLRYIYPKVKEVAVDLPKDSDGFVYVCNEANVDAFVGMIKARGL